MSGRPKPVVSRRVAYSAAAVLGTVLLIPTVPAIASSFSSGGSGSPGSQVVTLQVVDPRAQPGAGQIRQVPQGQAMYIACPGGHVLGGGYELPDGATSTITSSAPSLDSRRWNFRHAGVVPVGTKYYAICSTG
jgi:hypothetical protein